MIEILAGVGDWIREIKVAGRGYEEWSGVRSDIRYGRRDTALQKGQGDEE